MNSTITLAGNLTDDPQLSYTPSGVAVAEFSVAVNRSVQRGGEWIDGEPTFHPVKVWGKPAENVAESLARGDGALVHGHIETERWEKEGQTRSRDVVVVSERDGAIGTWLRFASAKPQKITSSASSAASE